MNVCMHLSYSPDTSSLMNIKDPIQWLELWHQHERPLLKGKSRSWGIDVCSAPWVVDTAPGWALSQLGP
jgi:hypothetical protein